MLKLLAIPALALSLSACSQPLTYKQSAILDTVTTGVGVHHGFREANPVIRNLSGGDAVRTMAVTAALKYAYYRYAKRFSPEQCDGMLKLAASMYTGAGVSNALQIADVGNKSLAFGAVTGFAQYRSKWRNECR